jgi:hypothetical protein
MVRLRIGECDDKTLDLKVFASAFFADIFKGNALMDYYGAKFQKKILK